ncbi:probable oligoribonuclease [Anopheles maculipalpis]|uniref:probable oligoribonuclease n=1 Tax=Anopheles maculipalpis TaxID=1496333 RepID=UPI002159AFC1|nr:probable oligoribonuclease [Anopheles maculipalpis]
MFGSLYKLLSFNKTNCVKKLCFNLEAVSRVHIHRMSSQLSSQNLVWMDLEMTGLDVDNDRILEIACIVTDSQLNIIAKGPNVVINEPDTLLNAMNDWCKEHHAKSGLIEAVKKSPYTLEQAEQQVLDFVKQYCPQRSCPMAGNSIYLDRLFVMKHMPTLNEYLHYRVIDVSTVKELCKRWNRDVHGSGPPKMFAHRSLDDIEESIKEMKYYRETFFKTVEHTN